MGVMVLQILCLVVKVCAFASFLVLQGSSVLDPPLSSPPRPEMMKGPLPSVFPSAPAASPPYNSDPPPVTSSGIVPALPPRNPLTRPEHPVPPVMVPEAPVSVSSPSGQLPQKPPSIPSPVQGSLPPNPHKNMAPVNLPFAPAVNAPAPRTSPHIPPPIQLITPVLPPPILPEPVAPSPRTSAHTPPPIQSVRPVSSPSILPEPVAPSPRTSLHNSPPIQLVKPVPPPSVVTEPVAPSPSKLQGSIPPVPQIIPHEPPFSSPGNSNATPISTPPPTINPKRVRKPFAAPINGTTKHRPPLNPSPATAPSAHRAKGDLDIAPPPLPYPKSFTGKHLSAAPPSTSTQSHHHQRDNMIAPAPLIYRVPSHAPINQVPHHPKAGPVINLGHHVLPPTKSAEGHYSSAPSPSSTSPSRQIRMPTPSPKDPSWPLPRNRKMPFHALPPPPPNEDCGSLTCSEPLTNSLPGPLCICVLPIKVGLRLSVELYTFFPLVPELAAEISVGVFMKQGQVRIMGANAASQDPEKTIVLIDLVPLGENFDNTTAYLTFQRFWYKQVNIKPSVFSDYEVLYVRYPGLPPSPPSASSDNDITSDDPYQGHDNNTRTIQPLGVDVRNKGDKKRHSTSIIAIVLLSASIAVIFCCALAWILFFKKRDCLSRSERTPPTTIPSLGKSSGVPASMFGSGPSCDSLSLGSSIATYAGSAKTFSSNEIERATDNFSETRVLGEGGFGRVYSGVLDGTKVAVKILKRDDHQGGREFLAEVEMLSRLHHRNLVKLIGICTEERTRCIVYELIPNGSVESHLHGVDKEIVPLDWAARLKIALGAARGLAYLHEDSSPRVIHRDFKSSNILLEDDFMPKVSDFGLARSALDEENAHISTRVMGTFGYVAPEYAMTGHLLVKSDVYSYGVVLLELLTGRKPVDMSRPPGEENLVSWARPLLTSEEGLASVVDPYLGPDFPFDSISKVAAIASMCVQPEVSQRPFMGEVIQALKLVCNEDEETEVLGSRSCSQEDLFIDMDAGIGTKSGDMLDPLSTQSPVSCYDPQLDIERGLSMSEILTSSANNGRPEYNSLRRHSSSGPLQTKNSRRLWQKIRRIYRGSASEHGTTFRFQPLSH